MNEYELFVDGELEAIVTEEDAKDALLGARLLFPGSALTLVKLEDDDESGEGAG